MEESNDDARDALERTDATPARGPRGDEIPNRQALLEEVERCVVKVGTNVLTRPSGEMALGRIHGLIEDIVDLRRQGRQVIVVSSGAISMGMDRLGISSRPKTLPGLQACAAIGQTRLMSVYEQALQSYGITAAQVLLTEDDFADRTRYVNLRNTFMRLLADGVIPIVNENDTVSTSEIETRRGVSRPVFGDNDRLSALVASKLGAGFLILLSDVDGLYRDYSENSQGGSPIPFIRGVDAEIENLAAQGHGRGRGGMKSKLQSIRIALDAGGIAVIANGTSSGILRRLFAFEEVGTLFLPRKRLTSRKWWLAHASAPNGKVVVNAGAARALTERQASLLFAGVTALEGEFRKGDVVRLVDDLGRELGRGRVNFGASAAQPLLGKRSKEIEELTGESQGELIHRDNIVISEPYRSSE